MNPPQAPQLLPEANSASTPRVLVLLATFNGAAFLERQIRSIAAQEQVRVSVLMSDDGSTDATVETALRTAATCGLDLTLMSPIAPTGSAARNFFRLLTEADLCAFDFVALADQDDEWPSHKLRRATEEIARTGADAYSCNSLAFWADGRTKRIRKDYPQKTHDHLFESASHGCTYALKASLVSKLQVLLRERRELVHGIEFHDWLIYAWVRDLGLRWHMDKAHCIRYRQTAHNVIGVNSGLEAIRFRLTQLHRGWLRKQSLATAACLQIDDPVIDKLRRFSWKDRIALAIQAPQLRRRPRDWMTLMICCLTIGI